jgi:hypothetical protein
MKRLELQAIEHGVKIGPVCPDIEPNVTEDCFFLADGKVIGFYMRQLPSTIAKIADIADHELRSERVPKQVMARKTRKGTRADGKGDYDVIEQYSTIIGSVPPKPHMRRTWATRSSVHGVKSATNFIKAMNMLCKLSEELIKSTAPNLYEQQMEAMKDVPSKWRFGTMFTSSISNYNIPAPYHQDRGNIKNTCNVIITKRRNSKGGNLHVPDYNATIDQCDNSILVYPAWRNVHGVTPIRPTHDDGYRNSLVFYPLKAFVGLEQ